MLPFKFVYHEGYDLNFGDHVFPSTKYRMVRERMLKEGFADPGDFVEPSPASDEEILRVHDAEWVAKLKQGTLNYMDILRLEVPYSRKMVEAFWLCTGGTILAARNALRDGTGFNIGGGFHHAFPGHGEGFCAIHDVAVAIRALQSEKLIERALVVDVDVHHGNGTAAIFSDDPTVFTLSIHQFNNYPAIKPHSDLDIHLEDGVGDEDYLKRLGDGVRTAMAEHRPEIVMHVAGADPYREDQLGGLSLTLDGLKARDRLIFELAKEHRVPVCVTLAGGYAMNVEDTVTIHVNTAKAAAEIGRVGG